MRMTSSSCPYRAHRRTPAAAANRPGRRPCLAIAAQVPGTVFFRTSVLFPAPLTPVTRHNTPSGNSTVTFCRLLPRAPRSLTQPCDVDAPLAAPPRPPPRPRASRRCGCPAALPFLAACLERRSARLLSPAPGPNSTTRSARRMISSSCSTTTTVLPRSVQLLDRGGERADIGRMQSDRRFVEHVQHVHEARAERRRERHALGFAAAKVRSGRSMRADIRRRRRSR